MNKLITKIVAVILIVVMAVTCIACGSGAPAATEVGTYVKTQLVPRTIEQGKLNTVNNTTISVFSDNTYILTSVMDTYYSSDGGETYNPVQNLSFVVYGKYETVETNEELGESTIKIISIDRVVKPDFDTATQASDDDKAMMTNNDFIGMELILGSDHKLSDIASYEYFYQIGGYEMPF